MIPLKLQIKNFVSYGQKTQTINFEPYNLICLSGKNGHGKSALLDALTWCLWGQARKISGVSKADEGLIRLGQSNMMVCLDFICNNLNYRVKREYTLTNAKSYSHLDFGVIEKETQQFKSLTDKTIRATQEKIEKTIGIDYDSFINSAFLRQGQSNEFSKKTPRDRKEILATILGINQFEELRKKAQEKCKDTQNQKDNIIKNLEQCQLELKEKDRLKRELENSNENFKFLLDKENLLKLQVQQLKEEQEKIVQNKLIVQQLNFEKNQLKVNIANSTNKFIEESSRFRTINKEKKKLFELKNLEADYQNIKTKFKELQAIQIKQIALKEEHIIVKEKINLHVEQLQKAYLQNLQQQKFEHQKIEYQLKTNLEKIAELQNAILSNQQEQELFNLKLEKLKKEILSITNLLTQQVSIEKQFDKRKAFYHKFVAQKNYLTTELQNIVAKKNIIKDNKHPQCPLCNQNLESNDKNRLCQNIEKQETFYNYRLKKLSYITDKLKKILIEQQETIENYKNKANQVNAQEAIKNEIQNKLNQLQENISILKNNIKEIEAKVVLDKTIFKKLDEEIITLEATQNKNIQEDKFYQELCYSAETITQELKKTNYDHNLEIELTKKIETLDKYKDEQTNLLQELALQEQRKKQVNILNQQIKEFKKNTKYIEDKLKETAIICYQESELNKKADYLKLSLDQLSEQKEILIHKKGALEQQNRYLDEQEKKYNQLLQLFKTLDQATEEYKAIALALSKDGIQALLIEDALPEIEQEANNILSKLTENQAQLSFDSLRDLRNGNTKETLDIKISDTMGIRPYELFSGGEAFRIDFALRIAISKLLARRAGTALQTLIIDEGFGSQDEEGLSNIMQALYKIQDDFSKVIIVSHLQSMKEQFPVHFMVQKGPDGSAINIIEQD